ncbi:MAG: chemotaxis protein CheB [Pseudomonadota bacterium]
MADSARRVALLARPGAARDCVRTALLDVGAELVAEEDPTSADPQAVRAASPQVLMIVLDAAAEDALGRFDAVIGDPDVQVMFEEAEVALSREGWEAARWRRHLAAKLHRSGDVLPPVGAVDVPAVDALSMQIEELIGVGEDGEAPVGLPAEAAAGQDFSVFDPAAAETAEAAASTLGIEGMEYDAGAFDAMSFDPVLLDVAAPDAAPDDTGECAPAPGTGPDFSPSDFDPLLAELEAELPGLAPPGMSVRDWEGGLVEGFGIPGAPAPVEPEPAPARPGFGELSLADDVAPAAPARARGTHDLADLERRISGLQLVDDAPRAPAVVLLMAGLGGPDAVRQFLGGLPADFACPVLVRQRLDGARYDKLVAQMQRATSLPVALAEAGRSVTTGTVYVVGDDVGLDASGGLRFAAGAGLLETLPAGGAIVLLSGSDVAEVDRVAAFAARDTWLGAQASDGCYDPAASEALAARGAVSAAPAELARRLARRWSS